jgi:hypothetical protein
MWPTMEKVEAADQHQLCMWYQFLPSSMTKEALLIEHRIFDRWCKGGGFNLKTRTRYYLTRRPFHDGQTSSIHTSEVEGAISPGNM